MPRVKFTFTGQTEAQIAADPDITFARASGGGRVLSNGDFAWNNSINVPRQDHEVGTGTYRGMLLETRQRINHFRYNNDMDFSHPDFGPGAGAGNVTINANSLVGIDGALTGHEVSMPGNEARFSHSAITPDGRYPLDSLYYQRNGDPATLCMAWLENASPFPTFAEKHDTPVSGWGRIVNKTTSFVPELSDFQYPANRRNHPDGLGGGPATAFMTALQTEFESIGRYYEATSYIPTTGAIATRSAESMTLLVPDGRYNVVITGDGGVRSILVNQLISGGSWEVLPNPMDWHIQDIEFVPVLGAVPNGGPAIQRKTVGFGGDYADWPAAAAALPANLVTANEVWWFVQLPGTQDLASQLVLTTVTDPLHPLVISSAVHGHPSHNNIEQWYNTRDRTRIERGTGQAVALRCDYAQVSGMAIQGLSIENATTAGDAGQGVVILQDCIIDRLVDRSGGAYLEAYNCLFKGFESGGIAQLGGPLNGLFVNCTAMFGATEGTTANHDGLVGGALINCIAANYFTNSGLQSATEVSCATTDGGTSGPGANLTYSQIFENAFPDPAPATGLGAIVSGDRWALAQHDIRQVKRPSTGVVPGAASDVVQADLTIDQIVDGLVGGQGAVISKGNARSVTLFNKATWSDTGGNGYLSIDQDWHGHAFIEQADGNFILTGHGGGHNGYAGIEVYAFRSSTRKWEVTEAEARRRFRATDVTFGSNMVKPNVDPYDPANPAHFDIVTGAWQAFHCYGGNDGNPAWFQGTGNTNGYLSFIPSSSGPDGNGSFVNRGTFLNLDTMRPEAAWSTQNGETHPATGNRAKAFLNTDTNEQWYVAANNVVLKIALNNAHNSRYQTGAGQPSGQWQGLSGTGNQITGLFGAACYWPGNSKAVFFQPAAANGSDWVWCDVSSGNAVLTPFTPTGDVPPDGTLYGMNATWVPTKNAFFFYDGRRLWEFNPVTEVFTERTPSQLGLDYKEYSNNDPATQASRARIWYWPTKDMLVLGGRSYEDLYVYNPADTVIDNDRDFSGTGVMPARAAMTSTGVLENINPSTDTRNFTGGGILPARAAMTSTGTVTNTPPTVGERAFTGTGVMPVRAAMTSTGSVTNVAPAVNNFVGAGELPPRAPMVSDGILLNQAAGTWSPVDTGPDETWTPLDTGF